MDSLDLFFKKYAYKFPKGYPDMNNEQDINLLADLLENLDVKLSGKKQINEQQSDYDALIKKKLGVEEIPVCETSLELGTSFNINGKDAEVWKALFDVKPIAARTGKATAGSGNGEISVYWAFQYNKNSFQVQDGRGGEDPDLIINGIGVEIKDYSAKSITLGKFGKDARSYGLLSNLFGFKSLLETVKEGKFPEASKTNPGTFKSSDLIEAARVMLDFYKETRLKEFAQEHGFEMILNLFKRVEDILTELGLSPSATPEDVAGSVLQSMAKTKLGKKPMLGKDKGYILNVNGNGSGKFYEITSDKIDALEPKAFLNKVSVASSELKIEFDELFK